MSSVYPIQNAFNRGEVSPLLHARADVDFWRIALAECLNFQVLPHGGLRRRSATRFITETANSAQITRLFPFKFSEEQAYVLAVNAAGSIHFLANRGFVTSGGVPYTIAHTWTAAAIPEISFTQFNDVMYCASSEKALRKITRIAETNWTIADAVINDGPWLDLNATSTTLTIAAYGKATQTMTSNVLPTDVVDSSSASVNAYKVFDNLHGDIQLPNMPGWISYTYSTGSKVVDGYWVRASSNIGVAARAPTDWKFEGYNGTDWVVLDARTAENGWSGSEYRHYNFKNYTAYSAYRFSWFANDTTATEIRISELGLHERAEDQTPFNVTASSITGINGNTGFQAADVGRVLRIKDDDGRWRWLKITSWTSTTVVKAIVYEQSFTELSPAANWHLGAFSQTSGWPSCVGLYNERLCLSGLAAQPVNVYMSKQGEFEDFGQSVPLVGADGISISLLSSNMNRINWLVDDVDLIAGSGGQVRAIGPSDFMSSFSATNITQRKGPRTGASRIQPIEIGGVILYVGAGGTKIRELVMGDQNRYVAPEISLFADHFFKSPIVEWSLSERPDPLIWIVRKDGGLVSLTYDREQKVVAFAEHDVGGLVESVAVIPSSEAGYDDVYLVVKRTINGVTKRYIEVLEHPFDGDTDAPEDAFFVDCGLSYDGAAITTVTGLGHLEGESVVALCDGSVVNDLTVESGQIVLPTPAEKINVGLPFTSRAVTLRASGPTQDGTLFGRKSNNISGYVDVLHTGTVKVGAYAVDGVAREQIHKDGGLLFGSAPALKTGFVRCEIDGSWASGDGQIIIEASDPLPCLVRALVLQTESEP